jgi:hypothetical protein
MEVTPNQAFYGNWNFIAICDFSLPPRRWDPVLFWDITQRKVVIRYRRFGTTFRSHLKCSYRLSCCIFKSHSVLSSKDDGCQSHSQNSGKRLLLYLCLPVRIKLLGSHGTGYALYPIFEYFSKTCHENSSLIKNLTRSTGALQEGSVHLWQQLADFAIEWQMFQMEVVEKIKTHDLCSKTIFSSFCLYCIVVPCIMISSKSFIYQQTHFMSVLENIKIYIKTYIKIALY